MIRHRLWCRMSMTRWWQFWVDRTCNCDQPEANDPWVDDYDRPL